MVRKTKRNMEKLVTIIDQLPLASRPYTAQDGTQKVFNSRGFILSDGIDEFYAEMTGDMAVAAGEYDRTVWHVAQDAGLHAPAFVPRQERGDTV